MKIVSFMFICIISLSPKPKPTPARIASSITHTGAETAVLCAVVYVCHATAALHVASTQPRSQTPTPLNRTAINRNLGGAWKRG